MTVKSAKEIELSQELQKLAFRTWIDGLAWGAVAGLVIAGAVGLVYLKSWPVL